MSQDLPLLGRAERTHDGYLREVRKLACYFDLSPVQLTQQQVADYLLRLINDRELAPGSLNEQTRDDKSGKVLVEWIGDK